MIWQHVQTAECWSLIGQRSNTMKQGLVKMGANITAKDYKFHTALQYAAMAGHTQVVCKLVQMGSDIRNIVNNKNTASGRNDGKNEYISSPSEKKNFNACP